MKLSLVYKYIIPLVFSVLLMANSSTSYADDYQGGNYPRFAYAQLFSSGESVSEKPNVLLTAIENGDAIPLHNLQDVKSSKSYLFPNLYFLSSYNADKLASQTFVDAMSKVVGEFACAEYRFRKGLAEKRECKGYVADEDVSESMPFVSGQYTTSPIEVNADDRRNRVSFYAYLPSAEEKSLESAFGSVHELGTFFGRFAHRRSLILSISLQAYWLDSDNMRKDKINQDTVSYFVVLPKAVDIAAQPDESSAAQFAIKQAKLLILEQ